MLLYPAYRFRRVWEISPQWLARQKITVLLLDVDNTLTTHDNPAVDPRVLGWLEKMRASGIRLAILSNNRQERVKPFAEMLGLAFFPRAKKPLGHGARRAMELLGAGKKETAVIGDQLFTDILCGRLAGLVPILVEPMELEPFFFFKLKRFLEKLLLHRCTIPFEAGKDRKEAE